MLSQLGRNLVRIILWFIVLGAVIGLTVGVTFANYQAFLTSFELLGYEMKPLGGDLFLGRMFGAFFPDATLAHFYATTVAGGMVVLLFVVSHLLLQIHHLYDDRRSYLRSGDRESAEILAQSMVRQAIYLVVLIIPLAYAINWDLELFRFRSIAAMLGIDDPAIAPRAVLTAAALRQKYPDLAATDLALTSGAYGYMGVTAMLCIGMEIIFGKLAEAWTQLTAKADRWLEGMQSSETEELHGYAEDGQPVFDATTPIVYGPDGEPLEVIEEEGAIESGDLRGMAEEQSIDEANLRDAAEFEQLNEANASSAVDNNLELDVGKSPNLSVEVDVIGGQADEKVRLSVAMEQLDRFYVDPRTFQVWDRDYWVVLQGPKDSEDDNNESTDKEAA